ncbi:hypothetical protein B0H14DRAFT_3157858 [Mycena olivaceomarginata]|nr:hypothetical protein B0H14DRAFT_3157858 [Mycena olivaceomarginata]
MPTNSPAKVLEYTVVAANALQDVAAGTQIPFLSRVCTLSLAIIPMVQTTKLQKDRCIRIMEEIHGVHCALINLAIHSEDIQSLKMLNQIAQFAITLQKLDSCLRAHGEMGTIKRLFKQSEITAQLENCETELNAARRNFTINRGVGFATALVNFSLHTERRHQELLELISSRSGSLDTCSSVRFFTSLVQVLTTSQIGRSSLNASSGSLSLLPASPKIFHGRESELNDLVNSLIADPARIVILGPGGMGKTALALTALHDTKVVKKYQTSYFVPCDSAHTNDSLVATIASHLGLDSESSRTLGRTVIHHLSTGPRCLLILDNFETPWEPVDNRVKVEEFLALLAEVPHIALLITMRGAERPSKVQWTHPFLRPLIPLPPIAAHQTFIEIADESHNELEVEQLLEITDNVPLAVQLVATIVASDGCEATLKRWKLEKTALLSTGYNRRSNLETSIMLSLSSPRMLSSPHAAELLIAMSLLSDGISDLDLVQSKLPIPDILKCKTILIRTSLAYVDHAGRLKVLAPIREYICTIQPPSPLLVRPLRKHLINLLALWKSALDQSSILNLTPRLISSLGNLHNILLHGLDSDHADIAETIRSIFMLSELNIMMNHGLTPLMLRLPEILAKMDDHDLHGHFVTAALKARELYTLPNPEKYIQEAIEHFCLINDLEGQARLYNEIAVSYQHRIGDLKQAEHFFGCALSSASQCNLDVVQAQALVGLAMIEWARGQYSKSLELAQKAYKIAVTTGDVRREFRAVRRQAMCYCALGDLKRSAQCISTVKDLVVRAGMQGGEYETLVMEFEANLYQVKTEYVEARHVHELVVRQTSAILSPVSYAYALVNIALLDIVTGVDADAVSRNLSAATTTFQNVPWLRGISACELVQAEFMLREGDAALRRLGDVLVRQGADDSGMSTLEVALEGFTRMDVHRSRAECMRTIGDICLRRGDLCRAGELWTAARPLFERSEQIKDVAEIDKRLQTLCAAQALQGFPIADLPTPQALFQRSAADSEGQKPEPAEGLLNNI